MSLVVLSVFFNRQVKKNGENLPSVTLIIAAYNEEKDIKNKLENSLNLDYPSDRLEIIVASDCSDDNTDQTVQSFGSHRVHLVRTPARQGKTGVQNVAVEKSRGDVIVFSDATTIYDKDALRKIVRNFMDGSVGGVEGRLVYLRSQSGFIGNKDLIKSYEAKIKTMESRIWGGIGDNGAFYAIRRSLWRSLKQDLTSDLATPLDIVRQHRRFIFEPEAISYEKVSSSSMEEFKRKIRTVRAGLNVFLNSLDLLNPLQYGWNSYVLIGRKFCRWLSSIMLLLLVVSNLFLLDGLWYRLFFSMQGLFYLLAITSFIIGDSSDKIRLVSIPKSFVLINVAAICGVLSYTITKNSEVWIPKR